MVTTSICWVSRATLMTGEYMSRHGHTLPAASLAQEAWAHAVPGLLGAAGYYTGLVGKSHLGPFPQGLWDFARIYADQHWFTVNGERVQVTERNRRDAMDFLRHRPKDRPFFLDVSFFAAHAVDGSPGQYYPQDWSAQYYPDKNPIPPPIKPESDLKFLPPFLSDEKNEGRVRYHWRFDGTDETYQQTMRHYYRLITEVDDAVGRLIAELKAEGVYDNTLIVYVGDNGYFQADRGLADKWYPYDESIRVPLIVRDPRMLTANRGKPRDEMVLNLDVAPTIVSAAGLKVPVAMQGRDMGPLYMNQAPTAWRDEFFYEHPEVTSRDRIPASVGVVRRDWKYWYWPAWDTEQLYDLQKDSDEIRNLSQDPASRAQLTLMKDKLRTWIASAK
jgi:arylsulfatase A-like enzyme